MAGGVERRVAAAATQYWFACAPLFDSKSASGAYFFSVVYALQTQFGISERCLFGAGVFFGEGAASVHLPACCSTVREQSMAASSGAKIVGATRALLRMS